MDAVLIHFKVILARTLQIVEITAQILRFVDSVVDSLLIVISVKRGNGNV